MPLQSIFCVSGLFFVWQALTLIIHLGPEEDYDIKYRQGFLFDIFQQAYGIRAVVHEPGTYPDIERQVHVTLSRIRVYLHTNMYCLFKMKEHL